MHTVSITEFGAVPGQLSTSAIQKAIDTLAARGGGTVIVPPGSWPTATIVLKSGINLHLPVGATLVAHTNLADYPTFVHGHNKDRQPFHLLYADGQHHISVTGNGTIDGRGGEFWNPPLAPSPWFREKAQRVSPLVEIRHCSHVTLEGITIHDSPGWTVHPYNCDFLTIRSVKLTNHVYGPNTDGFDINGCRDVFVADCHLVCGDDGIIIKSTPDARSTERVVVTNCVVRSNCIGIGLGAETASSIYDVAISNCVVFKTMRMFAIGMWDGGVVDGVVVSNIVGDTITDLGTDRPIHIDVKRCVGHDDWPLGLCRNVSISNVVARTRGRILMTCELPHLLHNISLSDIHLNYPEIEDPAIAIPRSRSNQLSNRSPEARVAAAAVVVENARNVLLRNITARWPEKPGVAMHALWARNVTGRMACPDLHSTSRDVARIDLANSDMAIQ